MTTTISLIGIDGSGKSTLTAALPDLIAAELGLTAAAVGDDFRCTAPEEDLLLPGFAPEGEPLAFKLDRQFRRAAKRATAWPRLYPPLKLAQLALQEQAAHQLAARYHPDVVFADGSLLLSALGRTVNYMSPAAHAGLEPGRLVETLLAYALDGQPLPPALARRLPGGPFAARLRWLDRQLGLGLLRLPEALIFIDVAPEAALARLQAKSPHLDRHENLADMRQAQAMYRQVVAAFCRRCGAGRVHVIEATTLTVGETLRQVVDFVRTLAIQKRTAPAVGRRLGVTAQKLTSRKTVARKMLPPAYLVRYLLPNLRRGSARELTFPLSPLGQLFFREGYSAGVMRAIYVQDNRRYGLLDRLFLGYPLHQAVYHRLQILNSALEQELRRRVESLPAGQTLKILTAPSGYAFDLLRPLARLAKLYPEKMSRLRLLASDLDPDGHIEPELVREAERLGVQFQFVRGDLTSAALREQFQEAGPYDMVVFVGLSSWIPKTHLAQHLKLVGTRLLRPGGVLVSDCFTPHAYALSGKYVGYQANYYAPRDYASLLAYCGFEDRIAWQSGAEGINHVCLAQA